VVSALTDYRGTKLVDTVGNAVAAGDTGELTIRGANIALGYWERDTGVAPFRDGWYSTGDAVD
jgi:long-subunit acyl-CoA synthetase (AMP-forming)